MQTQCYTKKSHYAIPGDGEILNKKHSKYHCDRKEIGIIYSLWYYECFIERSFIITINTLNDLYSLKDES